MIRQGDILIKPISNIQFLQGVGARSESIKRRNKKLNAHIIAEGEATGHHHVVSTKGVKMYERNGTLYLDVPEGGAELTHEEHDTLVIPAGKHEVQRQREYVAPTVSRRVYD